MLGSCAANSSSKAGEPPRDLSAHSQAGPFNICGLSADEFIKQHCGHGEETDISHLVNEFKNFCYDFGQPTNNRSLATEFCKKIIFDVGPESELKTTGDNNIEWRFVFPSKYNSLVKYNVSVCKDKSTYTKCSEDTLVLTVTQASLLALLTFGKIIEISLREPQPVYLLTPLATAVFPAQNLPKLLNEIKLIDQIDMSHLLKIINYSCQPGGQCLPESRADCAAVASIIATRHMKNKNLQYETIKKTLNKYLSIGKIIEERYYMLYGRNASQEIPAEFNYNSLMKIIKQ